MMRSARRRDELGDKKVGRETALRVLRFALPYRVPIVLFLVLVIVSSIIAVATPVLAGDVINIITRGGPTAAGAVVRIAFVIGGLAEHEAGMSMVQRFCCGRIGVGIIYDLRTQV